ncbi:MAG TPA: hypothetical protein VIJ46_03595, partial [Rhabdochlamydiaceae bacterium]
MSATINLGPFLTNINPVPPLLTIAVSGLLARTCTAITAGNGAMLGALAEFSAIVTEFVLRMITSNEALVRTASRGARLLGGYYLGNLTGWAPIAFGPTAALLTLGSLAIAYLAINTTNDIFQAVSPMRIHNRNV